MQKGFAPILIVLGILILISLVFGGYYLDKYNSRKLVGFGADDTIQHPDPTLFLTEDETINWESFTGKTFSLKHPKGWTINTLGSANDDAFSLTLSPTENPDDSEQSFSLHETKFTSKTQIETHIKKVTQKDLSQLESANLNGIFGYKEVDLTNTNLYFPKENTFYEITIQKNTSSPMLVDKILSSFKFLDQSSVTEEDAAKKVSELPEVKTFTKNVSNAKISLDGEDTQKNIWIIRVYEDQPTHQVTFNRYYVNKSTGEISKQIQ